MVKDNLSVENAKILFRNFAGRGGQFNPEGRRNFCVLLDFEKGTKLQEEGWKVKWAKQRDPDEDPQAYLPVAVSYDHIPPKIVMITSSKQTLLDESNVMVIDTAEIKNVNLIIRPYNWDVNGQKGVKAYLKTMYIELEEDEFAYLYKDIPETSDDYMHDDKGPF